MSWYSVMTQFTFKFGQDSYAFEHALWFLWWNEVPTNENKVSVNIPDRKIVVYDKHWAEELDNYLGAM